jgi:hypothetical protein
MANIPRAGSTLKVGSIRRRGNILRPGSIRHKTVNIPKAGSTRLLTDSIRKVPVTGSLTDRRLRVIRSSRSGRSSRRRAAMLLSFRVDRCFGLG